MKRKMNRFMSTRLTIMQSPVQLEGSASRYLKAQPRPTATASESAAAGSAAAES